MPSRRAAALRTGRASVAAAGLGERARGEPVVRPAPAAAPVWLAAQAPHSARPPRPGSRGTASAPGRAGLPRASSADRLGSGRPAAAGETGCRPSPTAPGQRQAEHGYGTSTAHACESSAPVPVHAADDGQECSRGTPNTGRQEKRKKAGARRPNGTHMIQGVAGHRRACLGRSLS